MEGRTDTILYKHIRFRYIETLLCDAKVPVSFICGIKLVSICACVFMCLCVAVSACECVLIVQ